MDYVAYICIVNAVLLNKSSLLSSTRFVGKVRLHLNSVSTFVNQSTCEQHLLLLCCLLVVLRCLGYLILVYSQRQQAYAREIL